jgi:hypothetical protein
MMRRAHKHRTPVPMTGARVAGVGGHAEGRALPLLLLLLLCGDTGWIRPTNAQCPVGTQPVSSFSATPTTAMTSGVTPGCASAPSAYTIPHSQFPACRRLTSWRGLCCSSLSAPCAAASRSLLHTAE